MSNSIGKKRHSSDLEEICTRIEVENFGPIRSGCVDLRPLTVFIGPSNTGKTYFAVLIYALHRVLSGFSRLPVMDMPALYHEEYANKVKGLERLIKKVSEKKGKIYLSDLPSVIHDSITGFFDSPEFLIPFKTELRSCFDLDAESSLISSYNGRSGSRIMTTSTIDGIDIWKSQVSIMKSETKANGSFSNQELLDIEKIASKSQFFKRIQMTMDRIQKSESWGVSSLMSILLDEISSNLKDVLYLPAARSGIMQSHRIIASSVMAQSTRAGLDSLEGPLTFPAMTADFLSRLIAYDSRGWVRDRQAWRRHSFMAGMPIGRKRREQSDDIKIVAKELESTTLEGDVTSKVSKHSGYPEFYYRPQGVRNGIRMNRVSSMVSELSPLVLFVRGNVCAGDTLIVEEPEAHLHPAAQTKVAVALAKLTRLGVRVVVTTHSDWLLKEFGNLIREGDLAERAGKFQSSSSSALRPKDVGAWLFHKDSPEQGSTISEVKFDSVEGIEPDDYEDVAERLYNRSAKLQDHYEELSNSENKK